MFKALAFGPDRNLKESRCQTPELGRCYIICESTCVAVALLLPCSGWGTTSADIPAAAESTAAHLWTLHRAVGNMGVLTWPADQSSGCHRTLQLGGGGEAVWDASHSHWWDTMGQLAVGGLRGVRGVERGLELQLHAPHLCFPYKDITDPNLLDGVMNDAGSSAGLVVVLEGGCSGLSLLQLLRHQLLRFQRRGWGATVGHRRGRLLVDALLYFLLLLQCFDKCTFQPIGMLRFQSLFLIGWHALFAEDCPAFGLVLPPATGKVSVALGADERVSDDGLGQCDTCLSWSDRDKQQDVNDKQTWCLRGTKTNTPPPPCIYCPCRQKSFFVNLP